MLHRCSHTLPWSCSSAGKPSDLDDVIREDFLVLVPLSPTTLFAAWNVSYAAQNRLAESIGAAAFDSSRLIIEIEKVHSYYPGSISYDVSGPIRSKNLPLPPGFLRGERILRIFGKIGYMDQSGKMYGITKSWPILLPSRQAELETDKIPLLLKNAVIPSERCENFPECQNDPEPLRCLDLQQAALLLDEQLGRMNVMQEDI